MIGGPHDNGAIGAAWVFARGDTWNEVRKLTPTTAGVGQYGYSVAPSSVGTTLIGAPSYGIGLGTAWVTAFNPTLSTCAAENEITFSGGTPIGSDYQNCTLVDLHQARAPAGGVGGLPNNGNEYCVPTSAMDWMVWLANHGYGGGVPPATDWTDPANFDGMSGLIDQMGSLMGTSATTGTSSVGLATGLEAGCRHSPRAAPH